MKRFAAIIFLALVVISLPWPGIFAASKRISGPFLMGYSGGAATFKVNINGDVRFVQAEDDGYLNFDLFEFRKLPNGFYDVRITPINEWGQAPKVKFTLRLNGTMQSRIWRIIRIKELLETEPGYADYFSEDLKIIVLNIN